MKFFDEFFGLFIILVLICGIGACSYSTFYVEPTTRKNEYAKQDLFFQGSHMLHCLSNEFGTKGNINGSFMLGSGHISGSSTSTEFIKFIWKNESNGLLLPTVLPANRVRFNIITDSNIEPYAQFSYYHTMAYGSFNHCWNECIDYALIYINQNCLDNSMYIKFGTN